MTTSLAREEVFREEVFRKVYKLRAVGRGRATIEVSIPVQIIEGKIAESGMSTAEFAKAYQAEWQFNSSGGAFLTFIPISSPHSQTYKRRE